MSYRILQASLGHVGGRNQPELAFDTNFAGPNLGNHQQILDHPPQNLIQGSKLQITGTWGYMGVGPTMFVCWAVSSTELSIGVKVAAAYRLGVHIQGKVLSTEWEHELRN